jgi:ribosomal protein L11 methyltransferase
MSGVYIEVVLDAPADDALRELLSFQLYGLGFSGFLETDNGFHCYIPKVLWNDPLQNTLLSIVGEKRPSPIIISSITEIQNQNWNRQWEESIQPVEVSERIVITPSWHSLPEEAGRIVLVIDPKMSFGTGYHESTRLMLRMMERYVTPKSFVLDVGTGTGILAIAAVKLGSRLAVGIDTDEWSHINAKENVIHNSCEQRVDIRLGSLEVVKEIGFDFILANITRGTITELFPSMAEKLDKRGTFLLSGLLTDDRELIKGVLNEHHCTLLSIDEENEWIGVAARKT